MHARYVCDMSSVQVWLNMGVIALASACVRVCVDMNAGMRAVKC